MMDIKKALKEISIDNCEKIGEGFYGNIYKIDDETIVKDALKDVTKSEKDFSKK